MLYKKAKLLLEMGESQLEKYEAEELKDSSEVLLIVGYVYEQALELILKYISQKLTGDFPLNHKIYIITNHIMVELQHKKFRGKYKLFNSLEYLNENTRKYKKLAYGAKYDEYIPFTIDEFNDMKEQINRLEKWLLTYGDEI